MHRPLRGALTACLIVWTTLASAKSGRFDLEAYASKDAWLFVSVDTAALKRGFGEIPLGRILDRLAATKGLASLRAEALDSLRHALDLDGMKEYFGWDFFDILEASEGQVALAMTGSPSDPAEEGGLGFVLAVEAVKNRRTILEYRDSLLRSAAEMGEGEAASLRVEGFEIRSHSMPGGLGLQTAVVGDCVLMAFNSDLAGAIRRFAGKDESTDTLQFDSTYGRSKLRIAGAGTPALSLYLNLEGLRRCGIIADSGPEADAGEVARNAALGLDRTGAIAARIAFHEGETEFRAYFDTPSGPSGLLRLGAECLGGVDASRDLDLVPEDASEVAAFSVSVGKALRILLEGVRGSANALGPEAEKLRREFETRSGLGLREDVYTLPKLELLLFSSLPATGGLIPDVCAIVHASEAEPWLRALDRLAVQAGAQVSSVKCAGSEAAWIQFEDFGAKTGLDSLGTLAVQGLSAPLSVLAGLAGESRPDFGGVIVALLEGEYESDDYDDDDDTDSSLGLAAGGSTGGGAGGGALRIFPGKATLCMAPVDGGRLLVASTPQAVTRVLLRRDQDRAKGRSESGDEALAKLLRSPGSADTAILALRGARRLPALYDTILSFAGFEAFPFGSELDSLGLDLARMPAGEEIEGFFRDGFATLRVSKDGALLHTRGVTANLLGSPVVHAFAARLAMARAWKPDTQAAGEAGPAARPSSPEAGSRLAEIGVVLGAWAERSGTRAFPHDPGGSIPAFQRLIDEGFLTDPSILAHPSGPEKPAKPGADGGRVILADDNVSYELAPWKQGPSDNPARILAYERRAYGGSRNVLFVDLSVKALLEAEFEKAFGDQDRKYGKKDPK